MELMGKLAWLVLSTYAAAVQSIGFEAGRNGVVDIHTLMAGMQVLQTVSVSGRRPHCDHCCGRLRTCIDVRLCYAPPPMCLQVAQIAHFLDIPAGSPTLSQITASWETESALRQALETTCRIRDRVESLADLQQKLPDDIEVNVMLQVLKHTLEDSCHWVGLYIYISSVMI